MSSSLTNHKSFNIDIAHKTWNESLLGGLCLHYFWLNNLKFDIEHIKKAPQNSSCLNRSARKLNLHSWRLAISLHFVIDYRFE